ncbi:hypothetical protein R1sor_002695 [Riccia sorocarpa]|uniref:RNA-binding protein NOB1 n=1 Tax=Riccia sorocarpa TaxID=122646 RepID=A0ABD3GZW4_9MARC
MTTSGEGGGGWASIARKDAVVEKEPDLQSLLSTAGLKTVVVDANAIIGGGFRLVGMADQYFTVREVLAEVRDPASRFYLGTLPVEIKCLEPSEDALTKVVQFARATGDVHSLSEVDIKLIALTYTLEAQVHGTDHIRARPPPLILTTSKRGQTSKDPPGWGNVSNPEEWKGIDEADGNTNTGSRILGLKSLSLDSQEPKSAENPVSGPDNQKEVPVNSALGESSAAADDSDIHTETTDPGVVREEKRNVHGPAEVDSLASSNSKTSDKAQRSELPLELDSSKTSDSVVASSEPTGSKQTTNVAVDVDGDDWIRAVSRSTRRQYQKRVQRRAIREQMASTPVSEAGDLENTENFGGARPSESRFEETSAHGAVLFSPEASAVDAKDEGLFVNSDGDCRIESSDLTEEGIHQEEAERGGADESVDDGNDHEDDTASSAGVASSLVDTEHSWTAGPMSTSSVACMTGDFAMQNVILQMGLRLLSPSGQHVKELNKWVLKCQACFKVTTETDRLFCPKCGNGGTLYKVSITVGPNGCVLSGRTRRPMLRGTRYSLPMPKGGREGAVLNPILREDQLPAKPRKVKKPGEFEAFSSSDVVFANPHERKGTKGAAVKAAAAIFSGRRNPNERRRSHK